MKKGFQFFSAFRIATICFALGGVAVYLSFVCQLNYAAAQEVGLQKYPSSILLERSDSIITDYSFPVDGAVRQITNYCGVNFIVLETVNGMALPPIVNGIELGSEPSIGAG